MPTILLNFHPSRIKAISTDDEGAAIEVEIYHTWQVIEVTKGGAEVEDKIKRYGAQGVAGGYDAGRLLIQAPAEKFFENGRHNEYEFQAAVDLGIAGTEAGHAKAFEILTHWWEKDAGVNTRAVKSVFTTNRLIEEAKKAQGGVTIEEAGEAAVAIVGLGAPQFKAIADAILDIGKKLAKVWPGNPDDYLGSTRIFLEVGTKDARVMWRCYTYGEERLKFSEATDEYHWQRKPCRVLDQDNKNEFEAGFDLAVVTARIG